jgi:mono/diheme cytochrome c family protein
MIRRKTRRMPRLGGIEASVQVTTNSGPLPANDPAMVAGAAIYRDQCSACHGLEGKGAEPITSEQVSKVRVDTAQRPD